MKPTFKNIRPALLAGLAALSMAASGSSFAQSIWTNAIDGTTPGSSNPFTSGQVVAGNITVSGIGRGPGITSNAGDNRYNATGWSTAFDANDYFTFTLDANAGFEIDFTSFVYTAQRSTTGPSQFALRSSLDGYTGNIGSPTATGATISLTDPAYQNLTAPVTFRLYAWGGTNPAGTFSVNDFTFNGTVSSAAPALNDTVITASPTTVAFGRVMQGSANPVDNVTLNKTGGNATTYTATTAGNATVTGNTNAFAAGAQNDAITVGIDRSSTGVKSGSVTIDNTATTSNGAGQGSADPNAVINASGTVLANRDITAEGGAVDFGKVFEDTNTDSASVTLNGGAQDDNNGTRVNINGGSVTNNGVTTTYTPGQGDDQFNSANETKTVSVTGNFAQSGLGQSNSANAAGLLGNGEAGSVGATVDSSVNINYTVDVYQKASLVTDNSSPIAVDEFGASVSVENAFSDDGGVRASAEIVNKQVSSGWQVTGLDNATVIAEGDIANGTATFDTVGKLAGTHKGTLLLGFQHEDQGIKGAAVNDLGTRTWNFNYTVASATANSGVANVQAGNSYAGYNLTSDAGLATNVALLAGTASATTEVEMTFNSVVPGGFAASNDALRVSDVVNLTGTDGDLIVLQISYDPADIGGALESELRLAWFDGGDWVLAIDGNTGGTDFFAGDVAWNDGFGLGAYGVDSATNTVWAVVNHNSNFSVVAIPEPATWGLLLGAGAVLLVGRRRRASRNS